MRYIALYVLCLFVAVSCTKTVTGRVEKADYLRIPQGENIGDQRLLDLIKPYRDSLKGEMEEIIGIVESRMPASSPESILGGWMADVQRDEAVRALKKPVDLGIMNEGGIRLGAIEAGPIKRSRIYELMPFDNQIVVLKMDGKTLLNFVNHLIAHRGCHVSRGASYTLHDKTAQDLKVQFRPIHQDSIYSVAMTDYVANGGDDCFMLKKLPRLETGVLFRNALLKYIERFTKAGQKIVTRPEGRVK